MTRFSATIVALFCCAGSTLAQPQALPAAQLKKIKAATVFIKVSHGIDLRGSGSGFVVHSTKDYGLIVTNEHVISPPPDIPIQGKTSVDVVFSSGQPDEWSAPAEVLFMNKEDDLALLKVGAKRPIPSPLPLDGADALPETTPVYVCGFPFGQDLAEEDKHPEISIGVASVSSNRTDANGRVVTVQLNGALNPGNSGGPVVTQDGKLVGVAVRTLRGAGIGFAVPPHKVRRAVQDVHFAPPTVIRKNELVRFESKYVDAFGNLKTLTAHLIPAPNAWNTPNAADISKEPQATRLSPVLDPGQNMATIEVKLAEGAFYWLQFAWTDAAGTTRRSVPVRVSTSPTPPEPIPGNPEILADPANPAERLRNAGAPNGPIRLDAPLAGSGSGEEKSNSTSIAIIAVGVGLAFLAVIAWLALREKSKSGTGRSRESRRSSRRRNDYEDDYDDEDDDRPRRFRRRSD